MSEINKAAQALGALGGKARARSISKERAREIGRKAGLASAAKRKQQDAEKIAAAPDCAAILKAKQAQDTQSKEKSRTEALDAAPGHFESKPN